MPDPHAAAEQQARAAAIAQHAAKSAAASDGAGGGAGDGGAGGAKGGDADARQAAAVKASQERLLRKMHGEHACVSSWPTALADRGSRAELSRGHWD